MSSCADGTGIADEIAGRGKRNVCATRVWQGSGHVKCVVPAGVDEIWLLNGMNEIEQGNVRADIV